MNNPKQTSPALLRNDRDFSDFFSRFFQLPFYAGLDEPVEQRSWAPSVDVAEDSQAFYLHVDLPGLNKDDIKVHVENGLLSIEGERKQEKTEETKEYRRVERHYGRFYRSFRLPKAVNADKIEANFKHGVLDLVIPKSEEAKPKAIDVKVA